MKIERPRHQLQKLLERSLETGDTAPLKLALQQTPPAEVESFLSSVEGQKRSHVERLLGNQSSRDIEVTVPGRRIHDVRAQKRQPWWGGVHADPLPAAIHPEPTRDIDVHGERFTKDDVATLLRNVSR